MQGGLALTILSLLNLWWEGARVFFAPGVTLQAIAIGLFVVHIWPRVRPAMIRQALDVSGE